MPPFNLTIHSYTPPSHTSPTPLSIKLALPSTRNTAQPLQPATHLQLSYTYSGGKQEIFMPKLITSETLVCLDPEEKLYEVEVAKEEIARAKVEGGEGRMGEVWVYAWKGEKVLGKWRVGEVEGWAV